MKRTIIALSTSLLLSTSLISQSIHIPDSNFLNALISAGVDTNGDLQIDSLEASEVNTLIMTNKNISDLTGIDAFVNLDSLDCSYNELTNIDISGNGQLRYLEVDINELSSIDISKNTNLLRFSAIGNKLTILDVSNNLNLEELHCTGNQLTNINITHNLALKEFGCGRNNIENLDLSQNLALEKLTIHEIGLHEIDLSNHVNLVLLNCNFNALSTLDVSNNKKLESLMCCCNDLSYLNLSQNSELLFVDCSYNPLLSLNVLNNTKLIELNCYSTQLTSLDVSNNTELLYLFCAKNSIQSLDLMNNFKLVQLKCYENQLDELNVFNLEQLEVLWCGDNNLTRLDISSNTQLDNDEYTVGLHIRNLPRLEEICVNELPFPPEGFRMDTTGSPNVQFTMDCTPILIASDTLLNSDSIEFLCSQDGMVYLVPENTGNDYSEISANQINVFEVISDEDYSYNLKDLSDGTYWLYAVSYTYKISNPRSFTIIRLKVQENRNAFAQVYPNPAINSIEIETSYTSGFIIEIFNSSGSKVKSDNSSSSTVMLDISELNSGVYFVKLIDNKSTSYSKFIKADTQ